MGDRLVDLLGRTCGWPWRRRRGRRSRASSSACSGAASRLRARQACTSRKARGSGSAIPIGLLDFDRLGLPDAAIADARRGAAGRWASRAQRHASLQGGLVPPLDACRPKPRRSARSTRSFSTASTASATTPIAGVSPKASAEGMAGVPSTASCCSAPAARAWRSRDALLDLGVGRACRSSTSMRRAPANWPRAWHADLPGASSRRRRDRRAAARRPPTASSTRRRSAWRNIRARPSTSRCSRRDHWVADIIYFPAETELLRAARALGCRTLPARAWRSSRPSGPSS